MRELLGLPGGQASSRIGTDSSHPPLDFALWVKFILSDAAGGVEGLGTNEDGLGPQWVPGAERGRNPSPPKNRLIANP